MVSKTWYSTSSVVNALIQFNKIAIKKKYKRFRELLRLPYHSFNQHNIAVWKNNNNI